MKLGVKSEQQARDGERRGRFFTLKERAPNAAAPPPSEPLQVAHEIGARFELVNEKLENAQRVAEDIRVLITLLGDIRGPIFEEFRERRIEHAELQAVLSASEGARERLEELERANVELSARASGAEASLADAESRVVTLEAGLRARDMEMEQLKLERAERRAQMVELEEQHMSSSARASELEEETASLRSRADQSEKRLRESDSQLGKLQQEKVLNEQETMVLQKRLEQANAESVQLSGRLSYVEEQLSIERKRTVDLESSRLAAEADNAKAARLLEGKIETRSGEVAALEAKLEAALARVAKLDELNTGLTHRLADANLRQKGLEDEKLVLALSQERTAATAAARVEETETMRRDFLALEAARAAAVERAEELARLASSRETAAKRAERQISLLKERMETAQADHARKRAVMDERLSKMQTQYERERAERAIVEGALETARRDRGRHGDQDDEGLSRETA